MAFYNNKVVAGEVLSDGIYLIRIVKGQIHMDYIKESSNSFTKVVLANDVEIEFDVDLDGKFLDVVYINKNHDLIIFNAHEGLEDSMILENLKNKTFYLYLLNIEDYKNIFYMQRTENKYIYKIVHLVVGKKSITKKIVDKVETYEIINPFRVINDGMNLIIAYYYKNQVCIKGYDYSSHSWSSSITLTDNRNKLYLDIMKNRDILHLVYCDYEDERFRIKYERFVIKDDFILKEREVNITDLGNNTDPMLILVLDTLWITWRESNEIISKYSNDNGLTFNETIRWEDTKKMDLVKYKYITDIKNEKTIIQQAYGTINKDIRFVGFGKQNE